MLAAGFNWGEPVTGEQSYEDLGSLPRLLSQLNMIQSPTSRCIKIKDETQASSPNLSCTFKNDKDQWRTLQVIKYDASSFPIAKLFDGRGNRLSREETLRYDQLTVGLTLMLMDFTPQPQPADNICY